MDFARFSNPLQANQGIGLVQQQRPVVPKQQRKPRVKTSRTGATPTRERLV